MEKKVYTLNEAMKVLGVGRYSMVKLANTKGFPAFKMNGQYKISIEGLDKWLEEQSKK